MLSAILPYAFAAAGAFAIAVIVASLRDYLPKARQIVRQSIERF